MQQQQQQQQSMIVIVSMCVYLDVNRNMYACACMQCKCLRACVVLFCLALFLSCQLITAHMHHCVYGRARFCILIYIFIIIIIIINCCYLCSFYLLVSLSWRALVCCTSMQARR